MVFVRGGGVFSEHQYHRGMEHRRVEKDLGAGLSGSGGILSFSLCLVESDLEGFHFNVFIDSVYY